MSNQTDECLVATCAEPVYARGLCGAHYARQRRGAPLDAPMRNSRHRRSCSADGCAQIHYAHGLCRGHYRLAVAAGQVQPSTLGPLGSCAFPACGRPTRTRGLCQKHAYIRNRLDLSDESLEALFADPRCGICERTPEDVEHTLRVDHDHSHHPEAPERGCDECVRGLLCHGCNVALGLMRERPDLLRKAADYLEKFAGPLHSTP